MSTINEEYEHWFKNKEYMVRDSTLAAYDLMYRNHIKNDEIANMEIKKHTLQTSSGYDRSAPSNRT